MSSSTQKTFSKDSKSSCPTFQIRQYFEANPAKEFLSGIQQYLHDNLTKPLLEKYCNAEDWTNSFVIDLLNEKNEKVGKARADIMLLSTLFDICNCARTGLTEWRGNTYPLRRYVPDDKELSEVASVWKRDWGQLVEKFALTHDWKQYVQYFASVKVRILKNGTYESNVGHPLSDFIQEPCPARSWEEFLTCGAVKDISIQVESSVALCMDTSSANLAANILRQIVDRYDKYQCEHKNLLHASFCFTPFADLFASVGDVQSPQGSTDLVFYDRRETPKFLVKQIQSYPSAVSEKIHKSFGADDIVQPLLHAIMFYQNNASREKMCLCITDLNFFTMALFLPLSRDRPCTILIDAYARPIRDEESLQQLMGWVRFAQSERDWRKMEAWEQGFCMSLTDAQRDVNWRGKIC